MRYASRQYKRRFRFYEKNILNTIAALVLSLVCAFPAQAATMESIANADSRFHYDGTTLTATTETTDTFSYNEMVDVFLSATRTCSGYEIPTYFVDYRTKEVSFNQEEAKMIVERTSWTDEWVKANVPGIAPSGMSKEQAKMAIFTYIASNYDYNRDIIGNLDQSRNAADAYSLIANNNGVCIAFSCAFRAMLEAVPFNPSTGLVDWDCTEANHIKVAIVENDDHMWNAIQEDNGVWGIYDTSGASVNREAMMSFYSLLGGESYDCHGGKIWHY